MKKSGIILAVFGLLLFQSPSYSTSTAINADNFIQLISHTSQYARIEGKIHNSEVIGKSNVTFLNFGKNFNTSLSVLIYNTDIPAFIDAGIDEPDKYFKNKKVIIEGIVRISNGKPEVIINSPNQIKIIED